jgi:hypothetical protein
MHSLEYAAAHSVADVDLLRAPRHQVLGHNRVESTVLVEAAAAHDVLLVLVHLFQEGVALIAQELLDELPKGSIHHRLSHDHCAAVPALTPLLALALLHCYVGVNASGVAAACPAPARLPEGAADQCGVDQQDEIVQPAGVRQHKHTYTE